MDSTALAPSGPLWVRASEATLCRGSRRETAMHKSDALPRRRQGALAVGALRLPPCPLRLPLLFPKISLTLRFSGALLIPLQGFRQIPAGNRRE